MVPSLAQVWSWVRTVLSPSESAPARRAALDHLAAIDAQMLWVLQRQRAWQELIEFLETPPLEQEAWMTSSEESTPEPVPEPEPDPLTPRQPSSAGGGRLAGNQLAIRGWMEWGDQTRKLPVIAPAQHATWLERIGVLSQLEPAMPLPTRDYGSRLFWGHIELLEPLQRFAMRYPGATSAVTQFWDEAHRPDRLEALPAPLVLQWLEYLRTASAHRRDLAEAACGWIGEEVAKLVTPWLDECGMRDTHAELQVQLGRWSRAVEITDPAFSALASQTVTALLLRAAALQDLDAIWRLANGVPSETTAIVREVLEHGLSKEDFAYRWDCAMTGVMMEIPAAYWEGLSQADRDAVRFLRIGAPA